MEIFHLITRHFHDDRMPLGKAIQRWSADARDRDRDHDHHVRAGQQVAVRTWEALCLRAEREDAAVAVAAVVGVEGEPPPRRDVVP